MMIWLAVYGVLTVVTAAGFAVAWAGIGTLDPSPAAARWRRRRARLVDAWDGLVALAVLPGLVLRLAWSEA